MNRALQSVIERTDWPGLDKEATFTTLGNGSEQYDFEGDYKETISITMWDRSNNRKIGGPVTPAEWQFLKGRDITSSVRRVFRFRKSTTSDEIKIFIFPDDAIINVFYEYIMDTPVISSGAVLQKKFLADSDSSVAGITEELLTLEFKWRWEKAKGLPYAESMADAERSIERAISSAGDRAILSFDHPFLHSRLLPEGNFG